MDHFDHSTRVRAQPDDSIRHWAELEGKSATMSDELLRSAEEQEPMLPSSAPSLSKSVKRVLEIVQAWLPVSL